jgi:hypothetical protein
MARILQHLVRPRFIHLGMLEQTKLDPRCEDAKHSLIELPFGDTPSFRALGRLIPYAVFPRAISMSTPAFNVRTVASALSAAYP